MKLQHLQEARSATPMKLRGRFFEHISGRGPQVPGDMYLQSIKEEMRGTETVIMTAKIYRVELGDPIDDSSGDFVKGINDSIGEQVLLTKRSLGKTGHYVQIQHQNFEFMTND